MLSFRSLGEGFNVSQKRSPPTFSCPPNFSSRAMPIKQRLHGDWLHWQFQAMFYSCLLFNNTQQQMFIDYPRCAMDLYSISVYIQQPCKIFGGGSKGLKRLSNLPKVTQLVRGRANSGCQLRLYPAASFYKYLVRAQLFARCNSNLLRSQAT